MKKSMMLLILLLALAACGIAAYAVSIANDDTPTIVFDGTKADFDSERSAKEIFDLTDMMPGDVRSFTFNLKMENCKKKKVTINLQTEPWKDAAGKTLDRFSLTVDGNPVDMTRTKVTPLYTFTDNGEKTIQVTVSLSPEAGNDYQSLSLTPPWTFTADIQKSGGGSSGGGSSGGGSSGGGGSTASQPVPTVDVPELLDGVNHFAYVIGRENEKVKPEAYVTRAEVATIFFRLLKEEIRTENLTTSNSFGDVNVGDWYNTAISTMAKLGIVKGYEDGDFHPKADITRAEFAAMCARFSKLVNDHLDVFSDISGHWAETLIDSAYQNGWINGYEDGTFHPDQSITRAEAMTLVNRVLHRLPETEADILEECTQWPDNQDKTAWYYLAVEEATTSHDYNRKSDGIHETWKSLRDTPDWSKYEK